MTEPKYSLSEIASLVNGQAVGAEHELFVSSLSINSREIGENGLFLAIPGACFDGHRFVGEALKNGAVAAVVSNAAALESVPGIVVADPRAAASKLAAHFAGYPSKDLVLLGITGTNGKSTITWILHHIFSASGLKTARLGTLGQASIGAQERLALTTPDALFLQKALSRFRNEGITHCVMEVSSHALDQKRVAHLDFDAAVFTNLTHDHLDYHGSLESYFDSKLQLFKILSNSEKQSKVSVANCDDSFGRKIREQGIALNLKDLSFSFNQETPVKILSLQEHHNGSELTLAWRSEIYRVQSPLIGRHNGENIGAAFAVWVGLGLEVADFLNALPSVPQVPGRLERISVNSAQDFAAYVDYAHSPDALGRVLTALRPSTKGRLTVVFGCGGERDRAKRAVMGSVAVKLADRVIVTSDNPRAENPQAIIDEILQGIGSKAIATIVDRRQAIQEALFHSRTDDTVLIAGKGHENYQIVGKESFPFSDQEEARKVLEELFPISS